MTGSDVDHAHVEDASEIHVRADEAVADHVEVRGGVVDTHTDISRGRIDDGVGCGAHALEGDLIDVGKVEVTVGRHFLLCDGNIFLQGGMRVRLGGKFYIASSEFG